MDLNLELEMVKDISKRLEEYDTTRPRMDELKFIQKIMDDYHLSRKEAVNLIQSVRRHNKR